MIRQKIELPQSCYFSDYFKLNYYPQEILAYFGYTWQVAKLVLPRTQQTLPSLRGLQERIERNLLRIAFDSELARREFLIAPVLMEVMDYVNVQLFVSYPLVISEQLKGSLDYYLESSRQLLIIEAKDENLERGFKQLAAELIAVDLADTNSCSVLYGIVSIGKVWQFAKLDRESKQMFQDVSLYRVPEDLMDLVSNLIGILEEK
jgi:hypothetical protein